MQRSESIKEIAVALISFNSEVSKISKDASNPFFKNNYATLDNIIDEIRPILTKYGLNIMQFPSSDGQTVSVTTYLLHTSGEFLESEPLSMKPVKADPQGVGSCISYARRYSLQAFLSLNTGSDDDGNGATNNKQSSQSKPYTPPKQPAPTTTANGPKLVSDAQVKAIGTKTSLISKSSGVPQAQVYKSAATHLKIDKSTRELTAAEASKVIEYLSTLE